MSQIKLTYFDMGGRAEAVRIAFHIGGIPFVDERLTKEEFGKQKAEGRFKYGQVPVLEVDGKQIAQTGALFRYAARRAGLLPEDDRQYLDVEEVLFSAEELQNYLIPTMMIQDETAKKTAREEFTSKHLLKWYGLFNKQLQQNGTGYFVGDKLTAADLSVFLLVSWFKTGLLDHIPKDATKDFEALEKHFTLVQSNEKVADWYKKNPPKKQ